MTKGSVITNKINPMTTINLHFKKDQRSLFLDYEPFSEAMNQKTGITETHCSLTNVNCTLLILGS